MHVSLALLTVPLCISDGFEKGVSRVIPDPVPEESIEFEGPWNQFNLTWYQAVVDHGDVYYELVLQYNNIRQELVGTHILILLAYVLYYLYRLLRTTLHTTLLRPGNEKQHLP